ncbi:hypothetical protein BDV12DRAFT_204972 [Aspergillus spectabilis]
MPPARKHKLGGDDGREGQDSAAKRRLRNRLSQRQFRERRSMYIKELDELAHANKKSESDRNNLLMQETAMLQREMFMPTRTGWLAQGLQDRDGNISGRSVQLGVDAYCRCGLVGQHTKISVHPSPNRQIYTPRPVHKWT